MAKQTTRRRKTSSNAGCWGLSLLILVVLVAFGGLSELISGHNSSSGSCALAMLVLVGLGAGVWLILRAFSKPQVLSAPISSTSSRAQTSGTPRANTVSPSSDGRFVEIMPGGQEERSRPTVTVSISYETGATKFLKDAQQYHKRTEWPTEHVPFMHYWPTYDAMGAAQQRWYFYWRSQIRQGNFLPTDLSYIFVHVYELLNLVEVADPVQAASRLWILWQKYRAQHFKLDNYLPDWGGDLLAVKVGINPALTWWAKSSELNVELLAPVTNALIQSFVQAGKSAEMPYAFWARLTAYRPRNKFYQEHNADGQIDRAYEKAIRVATDYWQRTSGQSLLEKFTSPNVQPFRKPVFTSAMIGYAYPKAIDLGQGRNYLDNPRLNEQLTSVVKYAENSLRKQMGFSRKLSGISLDAGLAQALDAAFEPVVAAPEPLRITIDHARVAALHQESEQIGALLEAISVEEAKPAKPLYTDLAQVRQLWAELELHDRQTITGIFRTEITTVEQLAARSATNALLPNVLIDRINERAISLVGDRLIYVGADNVLSLAEDFLDELDVVVAESPSEAAPPPTASQSTNGPWDRLFGRLPPAEIALIRMFAECGSLTETEIDAATRPYHTMANAALDSLNEKAVELLGHPPIYFDTDKWAVEEDDLVTLRSHLSDLRTN